MRPEEFVERLAAATFGAAFNFYREGDGAAGRRDRLTAYLESRARARLVLVGEAPGGHRDLGEAVGPLGGSPVEVAARIEVDQLPVRLPGGGVDQRVPELLVADGRAAQHAQPRDHDASGRRESGSGHGPD